VRRTLIIAAMLLPLPFAAIPIVSVVVSPVHPYASDEFVVNAPAQPDPAVDEAAPVAAVPDEASLTFWSGDGYNGCPRTSTTSIEG